MPFYLAYKTRQQESIYNVVDPMRDLIVDDHFDGATMMTKFACIIFKAKRIKPIKLTTTLKEIRINFILMIPEKR
jgi:hypothetical protein